MESQPQIPEFRTNPEIFHLCISDMHGKNWAIEIGGQKTNNIKN